MLSLPIIDAQPKSSPPLPTSRAEMAALLGRNTKTPLKTGHWLLLAIGLHQAWLGMISIVAFSLGLATVLVAFGAGVALLQTHSSALLQRLPGGSNGALGSLTTRATQWLPAASAILITTAGALMLLAQLA